MSWGWLGAISLMILVSLVGADESQKAAAEEARRKRLELLDTYPACSYGSHPGRWPKTEVQLRLAARSVEACGIRKKPHPNERKKFWNPLRTGEMTLDEVKKTMENDCLEKQTNLGPWSERMSNRVYAWSVDFHPAPGVCNFPIYNDIGVTLHLECDNEPFCSTGGVCRNRLKQEFGLGYAAVGFALDPEPNTTIKNFYEAYKDDEEMKRVDVFICSHPAANCELFEPLVQDSETKSMIMFPTTRLEFGRNDPLVHFREMEIKKMGTWFELPERWKKTIKFIHKYHSSANGSKQRLWLVANNMYDLAYTEYFTGIRPVYIPSWCGDLDHSFGHAHDWTGCSLLSYNISDKELYQPEFKDLALFVTHSNAHMAGADPNHPLVKEHIAAVKNFTEITGRKPPQVMHSRDVIENHRPEVYKKYKAVVWLPYQMSVMSFFEFYRQNIPMFAPSKKFLKHFHWEVDMLSTRIYGQPDRLTEEIRAYVKENGGMVPEDEDIPSPNLQHHWKNMDYWFGYADFYVFDHIILFDNFDHLLHLMDTVDLGDVATRMSQFNHMQRESIMLKWNDVFKEAAPHRDRSQFVSEYGIDEAEVRKWAKIQDKKIEMRIMQYQGDVNPCISLQTCTGSLGTKFYRNMTDPRVYDVARRKKQ